MCVSSHSLLLPDLVLTEGSGTSPTQTSRLEVGSTYLSISLNELSSTGSIYHSFLFVKYISQNIKRPVSDIVIFYKLSTDYLLYLS